MTHASAASHSSTEASRRAAAQPESRARQAAAAEGSASDEADASEASHSSTEASRRAAAQPESRARQAAAAEGSASDEADASEASHSKWWADAVVYQLYVRSFADSDGDGRGDLEGIRSRLDYIARLGADAIWLTPCFPSPQRDHGYDVADYFDIDPAYGSLATIDALIAGAHRRGMRVLLDVVPNHCSDQHPWFVAAVAGGPARPERGRFIFRDGRGPGGDEPPNNWRAAFGGPAWTRITEPDGTPGQWYLHTFSPWQPDWNWHDADVADHFDRVLRFWFDRGVDGFRVDAIAYVGKADDLPDAPPPPPGTADSEIWNHNEHSIYHPKGHAVWKRWRQVVDSYEIDHPGRSLVLVAEAYTPRRPDLLARFVGDDQFHEAFDFDLMLSPWNARLLRAAIEGSLAALTAKGALPAWALENHDTRRSVSRYGAADATSPDSWTGSNLAYSDAVADLGAGTRRARAALTLMLALPGSAFLYQGEELGLPEVFDIPDDARQDPAFHGAGILGRDGCRVPLPWTDDPATSYGFSRTASAIGPWLPQPRGWGQRSVARQEPDPGSMLSLARRAITARPRLAAYGGEITFHASDDSLLAFSRGDLLVVLNAGPEPQHVPDSLLDGRRVVLCSAPEGITEPGIVPPDSTVWFDTSANPAH